MSNVMIVTGGIDTYADVVAYDYDLNMQVLPPLNNGRYAHSCGHYVDNNGDEVRDAISRKAL